MRPFTSSCGVSQLMALAVKNITLLLRCHRTSFHNTIFEYHNNSRDRFQFAFVWFWLICIYLLFPTDKNCRALAQRHWNGAACSSDLKSGTRYLGNEPSRSQVRPHMCRTKHGLQGHRSGHMCRTKQERFSTLFYSCLGAGWECWW